MSIDQRYIIASAICASSVLAGASAVSAASNVLTVTSVALNVREAPSKTSEIIHVVSKGAELQYLSKSGNWYKIKYKGSIGYVKEDFVEFSETVSELVKKVKGNVNFRQGPGTSHAVISVIKKGENVIYLDTEGSWAKIKYNGKTGYVSKAYVVDLDYNDNENSNEENNNSDNTNTTEYVKVKASLNFRKGPGTSYSVINVLAKGTVLTKLDVTGKWMKVKYKGTTGYVSKAYVEDTNSSSNYDDSDNNNDSASSKYVAVSVGLNVRKGPGTSYAKIGNLGYGTKVTVLSTSSNGWVKIKYNSGEGYVYGTNLKDNKPSGSDNNSSKNDGNISKDVNEIIAYAKTFLGVPYSWGGNGPNEFDCSGFTLYVFKHKAGIKIDRNSRAQSKNGKYVSKSDIRAGDLVFFDTVGTYDKVITHVGLYIGNGQMIHASYSRGKIVIDNFYSSYFQRTFVTARRVL